MAEFCEECCKEVLGINPKEHPEWITKDLCENCGYKWQKRIK